VKPAKQNHHNWGTIFAQLNIKKIRANRWLCMKRFFLIIVILSGFAIPVKAESHFINKNASRNNDGTSWQNAWISFDNIKWNQVNPGDTIFISGGSSYNETLEVQADGTIARPIVIMKGLSQGHDGTVIFDGANIANSGIMLINKKYVLIQSLEFKNFIGNGAIYIDQSEGIKVDSCQIMAAGHGAIFIQRSKNCSISNNRITTSTNTDRQTDGIYSQLNSNNIYEGNQIIISNQNIAPHCDGIQMYLDTDMTVRNNYIEQNNNKKFNAQGIYATDCYGTIECYNNIVLGANTENALLTLANYSEGNAKLIAYHNTLVGGGWGTLHLKDTPNSIVKNNILVNEKPNSWLVNLEGSIADPNQINFNLYFAPNSSIVATHHNIGKNWSEWKNLGFESNGIKADPLFIDLINQDFRLSKNSPAIDSGFPHSHPYDKDKNGIIRPIGNGFDLGALEFINDGTAPNPPQNVQVSPDPN